jgi:hypothetical protein
MAENTLSLPRDEPTADVASTRITGNGVPTSESGVPDSTAVKSRKRARQIEGDEDEENDLKTGPEGTRTGLKKTKTGPKETKTRPKKELEFVVDPSRREKTFSTRKAQIMKKVRAGTLLIHSTSPLSRLFRLLTRYLHSH